MQLWEEVKTEANRRSTLRARWFVMGRVLQFLKRIINLPIKAQKEEGGNRDNVRGRRTFEKELKFQLEESVGGLRMRSSKHKHSCTWRYKVRPLSVTRNLLSILKYAILSLTSHACMQNPRLLEGCTYACMHPQEGGGRARYFEDPPFLSLPPLRIFPPFLSSLCLPFSMSLPEGGGSPLPASKIKKHGVHMQQLAH